jgi:hypothetical protein
MGKHKEREVELVVMEVDELVLEKRASLLKVKRRRMYGNPVSS